MATLQIDHIFIVTDIRVVPEFPGHCGDSQTLLNRLKKHPEATFTNMV